MTDLPANWVCITAHVIFPSVDVKGGLVLREKTTDKRRIYGSHDGLLSTWIPGTDIIERAEAIPADIWLRVTCSGSSYLMAHSPDGINWTQVFNVESLKKSDWNTYHHDQWDVDQASLAEFTIQ